MAEETFTIYSRKKEVLLSKTGDHIDKEYHLESDTMAEDGTRTIIMKPKDLTELERKKRELALAIAKSLGEEKSKLLKELLYDALRDYQHKEIEEMHKKVLEKKEAVKTRPGCFRIIIGDGRRKNCGVIDLR